ncbi:MULTISPECIES: DUF1444 domain-containing protein [Metabacillus]|uniref:DUF1444 domain-containing protein n=1 Tax=Metabacillus hrfriensis TaxID=3048891 RepID=A0ACD4R8R2_9BACI|nr:MULTISPECIES: DUF1444 domain-containing protein [Metabacillus]UAL51362.1 DUF1444 domain-containing protein [Metabacillus dongyingensis]USK27664.1 DUF1444 domain-containing protein [Bacillus sp. CMF21]WHZ56870.1 DUF1444 domain-containing protein [Metabacillus sp. CT-WN-B3]
MKMTSRKMAETIKERLKHKDWTSHFDREKDQLRVEDDATKKGITISLPGIIAKWEEKKDAAVDELVYYIEEALTVMNEEQELTGKEKGIFPVIRSTSFPVESSDGVLLIHEKHTAETRIYYALDLGNSYRLIDVKMMERENWTFSKIKEMARFNLRSLQTSVKEDHVAGNVFYFLNANDGYDASRLLNDTILDSFHEKMEGAMAIAVPHQDVLIIADIRNDTGYDILGQMAMSFFASGRVPITALSFLYENKELEPIFILAKNRAKKEEEGKQ